jgi:alanine racemase
MSKVSLSHEAFSHNVGIFRDIIGKDVKLCAVVKSNAYGHGLQKTISILLNDERIDCWAVNSLDEALMVRSLDVKRQILVMGFVPDDRICELSINRLDSVISSIERCEMMQKSGLKYNVHLKVDTGMGRLGTSPDQVTVLLNNIFCDCSNVSVVGIMAHFADAEDVLEQQYAHEQVAIFDKVIEAVRLKFPKRSFCFHHSATAASLLLSQAHYDMVRIGIGLYGLWPSDETRLSVHKKYADSLILKPVLSWSTSIIHIGKKKKGSFIGYGLTYRTSRDSIIAVLPIGYYEGYNRKISNRGYVLVCGSRARILGRVCMNMMMIDITDIPLANVGSKVVLIGVDGDEFLSVEQLASWSDTIHYDFLTHIRDV